MLQVGSGLSLRRKLRVNLHNRHLAYNHQSQTILFAKPLSKKIRVRHNFPVQMRV